MSVDDTMSVDIFGRKFRKSVGINGRGPPGNGFKITADGQFDIDGKRLCNIADPKDSNDAVSFGIMMTIFNSEVEKIHQELLSVRQELNTRASALRKSLRQQRELIEKELLNRAETIPTSTAKEEAGRRSEL